MISIVTSYYNRKKLFKETLKTISKSKFKDFELIAVDDGSKPEERIEDLEAKYDFLTVYRIDPNDKWYVNPCIPFNLGISKAKGSKIILQNPECLWVHDVLSTVDKELTDHNYISMSCYGIDSTILRKLHQHNNIKEYFETFPQQPYRGGNTPGWYNHSKYRPVFFHFCSAITKTNMDKLGGFNPEYAYGIGYDDNEITLRIAMMGLQMLIKDDVSVIHQYHEPSFRRPNEQYLYAKNLKLYNDLKASYDIQL